MKKLLMIGLVGGAAMAATPALAQTAFQGPYIGAVAGVDHIPLKDAGFPKDSDGIVYGVTAGYDFATPGLVMGIEGELTDSSAKACADAVIAAGDSLCFNSNYDIYVGGRVGTMVSPATLVYAKAGYTSAKFKGVYTLGTTVVPETTTEDGWRAGAGLEFRTGTNTSLKGEYRYSTYGEDSDRHQVVLGVNYRF